MPLSKSNLESEHIAIKGQESSLTCFFLCKELRASLKDSAKPSRGEGVKFLEMFSSFVEGRDLLHDFLLRQCFMLFYLY